MPSSFTFEVLVYPNFAYNTGDDPCILSWYWSANVYLKLYYNHTDDKFRVEYKDGGTLRYLESQQFDDGSSYDNISAWLTFTGAIDLTTGTTAGSQFWVDRVSKDTAWDGNIDARTTTINRFQVRAVAGTAGDYKINYLRILPSYVAADAAVQNAFRDVYNAEIFWGYNNLALGNERCNITRFGLGYSIDEQAEKDNGAFCANIANITLLNEKVGAVGCFCDDQYAAFTPASYQYNGTVNQKYLQNRIPIWIETWYNNDFDSVFIGKVTQDAFPRSKDAATLSRITISCEDAVSDIALTQKKRAVKYENFDLCDTASEATSLLHTITRLATKPDIYNYLANSSFENATITDSWAQGANCTLTRSTDYPLIGTYGAKAVFTGAGSFYQTVTFTGLTKLNVGENWTFSVYALSAAAFEGDLKIGECDSGGENDNTAAAVSLAGGEGLVKFTVTHTITDSTSDRLKIEILADAADTLYCDCAMLVFGKRDYNYFVLNDNDGAAGVESADDADAGSYDYIGFDVDSYDILHPWVRVEAEESIWEHCKDIANATPNLQYFGINSDGLLEYQHIASEGGDPASTATITAVRSIATALDGGQPNKVVISGIKIVKDSGDRVLWRVENSGIESENDDDFMNTVGIAAVWPSPATYGDYYAKVETV
jgi:hypothetical protein